MEIISIFDTSVSSSNLGNKIIMDSVNNMLSELFSEAFFLSIQTHDIIGKHSYDYIVRSNFKFVGGTNLLTSDMTKFNQWRIDEDDTFFLKDVILCGVGWLKYEKEINEYTKNLYHNILSKNYLHSVRDSYTERKLKEAGFNNVLNTACPTMWSLTKEHCSKIPVSKSKDVLLTFTEYNQELEYDLKLFQLVKEKYENIYFWTQQPNDYYYMNYIAGNEVKYITPTVKSLNDFLCENRVDYIGTRLHAGIKALQHAQRTLILSVDNRANEIAKDTKLPVTSRYNMDFIDDWIDGIYKTEIQLPIDNIEKWKKQFQNRNLDNYTRINRHDFKSINQLINKIKDRDVVLFGAGSHGKRVMEILIENGVQIEYIIDNNQQIWGSRLNGVIVGGVKNIKDDAFIIIASSWFHEISIQLEQLGYREGHDYAIFFP